jgi:hypothetical protein
VKLNNIKSFPLIILILALSLGCNLLQGPPPDDSSKPSGDGEQKTSESGSGTVETSDDSETQVEDDKPEDEDESADDKEEEPEPDGNQTKVVKFGKGKTSRSYSSAVIRATSNTYILGASKGQNMSVRVSSTENNAVFRIVSPSGNNIGGGTEEEGIKRYNGVLPASGKYKIIVTPTRGNATYNITFGVSAIETEEPPPSGGGGLTTTVRFKKGASSASYSNAVIRGERNTYILGASGGQLMSVSISSLEANAVFDVIAPNGRVLASERTSWSGQLPLNGKYRIEVGGTRGNASYRVNFAVR